MAARPVELFEPGALTPDLLALLGEHREDLLADAAAGDRAGLRAAERAWCRRAESALQVDIAVAGLENVDPAVSYLVAPLHEGFADVLALLRLPLDLTWVIRDELLELPFFGEFLELAGHIAVKPESPLSAYRTILAAVPQVLAAGESLVVFPQGSLLGIETAFQPGAFRVAERFGLPLLPVVLTGSHRVWEYPFSPRLRHGQRISLQVLDPVPPRRAVAEMRTLERTMKRIALAVDAAPARRYVPERDGLWEGYRFAIDPAFPDVAAAAGRG